MSHLVSFEHPYRLEDCPAEVLRAWATDAILRHDGDLFGPIDGLTCITAERLIPPPRAGDPIICPSCGTPISPTGECRCSD